MTLINDASKKDELLAAIKDWLKKQPHLPDEWEDSCLRSFLRGCKYSLEKTKKKLDLYFTMREACPEFFADRDITRPELLDLMSRTQLPTMPGLTPDGKTVNILRGLDSNIETERLRDTIKIVAMIADISLREQTDEVTGQVTILDAQIIEARHLGISPSMLKKFFIGLQEAFPIRLKEVHVVNTTTLATMLFNILKHFLNEKIKRRIIFHKDYSTLQTYIPKNMIPEEYGGTGCTLVEANKIWIEKLTEYRGWFKEQESLKANEALRPGKPTNYDELFGVEGSFTQLHID